MDTKHLPQTTCGDQRNTLPEKVSRTGTAGRLDVIGASAFIAIVYVTRRPPASARARAGQVPGFVVISDRKPFDWNGLRCPPSSPNGIVSKGRFVGEHRFTLLESGARWERCGLFRKGRRFPTRNPGKFDVKSVKFKTYDLRRSPPNHAFLSEVLSAQQATQRVDVWWKVQKRLFGSPETMRLEAPEDYAEVPGLSLEEAKALVRLRLKRSGPYARPRDAGPESPAPAPES